MQPYVACSDRRLCTPLTLLTLSVCVIVDYAIPGTPATSRSQCSFTYRSSSDKFGTFISPRHPSYYPDSTTCDYEFIGLAHEQVRITFENFEVENGGTKYVVFTSMMCSVISHSVANNDHRRRNGGARPPPNFQLTGALLL